MKWLTLGETAELLQVDRTTIWRWTTKENRFAKIRRKGFSEQSHYLIAGDSIVDVAKLLGFPDDDVEKLRNELEVV